MSGSLPLFIISQVICAGAVVCLFTQYQLKSKVKIMWLFALANVFYTLSCVFLFDWIGVGVNVLAVLRQLAFIVLLIKRDKIPRWASVSVLLLFLASAVAIMCVNVFVLMPDKWSGHWSNHWLNWLILTGQIALYYGAWCSSANRLRICHVFFASIYVFHCVRTFNWVYLAAEVFVIISVILFYSRKKLTKGSFVRRLLKKFDIAKEKTRHTFNPFVTHTMTVQAASIDSGHADTIAGQLLRKYNQYRKSDRRFYELADFTVCVEYHNNKVIGIQSIQINVSHDENIKQEELETIMRDKVIEPVFDNKYLPGFAEIKTKPAEN